MTSLIQSIGFELAGLGLLGAGAYCLVTGKGGSAASTSLMSLGGAYLGYKVSSATTVPGTSKTVTVTPVAVPPVPAQ